MICEYYRVSLALRARNPGRVRKESGKSTPGQGPKSAQRVRPGVSKESEKSLKSDFRTLFGLFRDSGAHSLGTFGALPRGTLSGLFSDSSGVPGPKGPGDPVWGGAPFFLFAPFAGHPFSAFFPAPFSPFSPPLKSALFCRARGTAQSLERGSSRIDLSTNFRKEIPSRNLREKRSGKELQDKALFEIIRGSAFELHGATIKSIFQVFELSIC